MEIKVKINKNYLGVGINKKIFILMFIVYIIIIYSILKPLENYLVFTVAYHSCLLLGIFTEVSYYGDRIYLNGINIEVIAPCTGVVFISIYLALILSLSRDIKEVLAGLPLLVVVYFGNLLRIIITGIFGKIFIKEIYWVHELAGYLITPIFLVIAAMMYLKILSKIRNK